MKYNVDLSFSYISTDLGYSITPLVILCIIVFTKQLYKRLIHVSFCVPTVEVNSHWPLDATRGTDCCIWTKESKFGAIRIFLFPKTWCQAGLFAGFQKTLLHQILKIRVDFVKLSKVNNASSEVTVAGLFRWQSENKRQNVQIVFDMKQINQTGTKLEQKRHVCLYICSPKKSVR